MDNRIPTITEFAHLYFPPLKKKTDTKWYEKIMLIFVKLKCDRDYDTTLVYKEVFGKKYIINHFYSPPEHWMCRCQIKKIP